MHRKRRSMNSTAMQPPPTPPAQYPPLLLFPSSPSLGIFLGKYAEQFPESQYNNVENERLISTPHKMPPLL